MLTVQVYRPGKRGPVPKLLEERFWPKVLKCSPSECWFWMGQRDWAGYGRIRVGSVVDDTRAMKVAHRVAYELSVGPIPGGLDVLHHCDNPPCCNPVHLFIGTHADNDRDRDVKGRGVAPPYHFGEQHPSAKLNNSIVGQIHLRIVNGETQSAIARSYGVCHTTIGRIIRGKSWKHLADVKPANG